MGIFPRYRLSIRDICNVLHRTYKLHHDNPSVNKTGEIKNIKKKTPCVARSQQPQERERERANER